jgi:hypothetical protein
LGLSIGGRDGDDLDRSTITGTRPGNLVHMRIDSELRDVKSNDCWNVIYYMLLSSSTHIYQCGDSGEQLKGVMKNVDENIDDSTMRTTSNDLGVLHATQSTLMSIFIALWRVFRSDPNHCLLRLSMLLSTFFMPLSTDGPGDGLKVRPFNVTFTLPGPHATNECEVFEMNRDMNDRLVATLLTTIPNRLVCFGLIVFALDT